MLSTSLETIGMHGVSRGALTVEHSPLMSTCRDAEKRGVLTRGEEEAQGIHFQLPAPKSPLLATSATASLGPG